MSHPYSADNRQVICRGVACYARFSSWGRFFHSAPASGFLEWINAFEETACRRARLKRYLRRICPELAYISSLWTNLVPRVRRNQAYAIDGD